MAYISYVFTVNPGRHNRYTVPSSNIEVKAISATDLEVWVMDSGVTPPIETFILRNDILFGVSVIVGGNVSLQFYNPGRRLKSGYIGATT